MSPGATIRPLTSRTDLPSRPAPSFATRPSRKPTSMTESISWDESMTRPPRRTRSKDMSLSLTRFEFSRLIGSLGLRQKRQCGSRRAFQSRESLCDPVKVRVSHMTPIVERDLAHAAFSEGADRCEKFPFRFEIGKGRAQDAAQTRLAAQTAFHVEEISFDPLRPRFVEAGFDDSRGLREAHEIAPLIPGAPGRSGDRRNDRNGCVLAHRVANFAHKRGHH